MQALQAGRLGSRHPEVDEQLLDLAVGLGHERLALVEGQGPGELVAARLDGRGHALHGRRTIEGRDPGPGPEGIAGRHQGTLGVRTRAARDRGRALRRWPG